MYVKNWGRWPNFYQHMSGAVFKTMNKKAPTEYVTSMDYILQDLMNLVFIYFIEAQFSKAHTEQVEMIHFVLQSASPNSPASIKWVFHFIHKYDQKPCFHLPDFQIS